MSDSNKKPDAWRQVTASVAGADEAMAAGFFEELGALAITTEGREDAQWLEAGVAESPAWHKVSVTGLFDANIDVHAIAEQVRERFDTEIIIEPLADRDWIRESIKAFKPIRVGRRLVVRPTWCDSSSDTDFKTDVEVQLDPGLAFGTGSHPTTAMCLDWLSRIPSDCEQFLDYGCGSGVLSIAALLLGAEQATAVDIDPQALLATRANAETNGVRDRLIVVSPDVLDSEIDFDIVVANILAATLKSLSNELGRRVRPDGWLVLSGILPDQANEVTAAFGGKFKFTRWQRQQWMLLFARKS